MNVTFVLYARNLPLDGRRGSPCAPVGLIHEIRAVLRGLISELPQERPQGGPKHPTVTPGGSTGWCGHPTRLLSRGCGI